MTTEVIHLTTTENFILQQDKERSALITEKFIESCMKLDASIFEPYMHEEDVFQNANKYLFLDSMKKTFDRNGTSDKSELTVEAKDGKCNSCNKGKPIKHFMVLDNRGIAVNRFGYFIKMKDGILNDIYSCRNYCAISSKPFLDNNQPSSNVLWCMLHFAKTLK